LKQNGQRIFRTTLRNLTGVEVASESEKTKPDEFDKDLSKEKLGDADQHDAYIQGEVLLPRRVPSMARVVNCGKDEIITFGEMPSKRRWVM